VNQTLSLDAKQQRQVEHGKDALESDLVLAAEIRPADHADIRTESAEALLHHFGVTAGVVWRWRKAFGISQYGTPGSEALHAQTCAKGAAGIKAKVWTDEELDAKAELSKRLGLKPTGRWAVGGWTAEELTLLGTHDDDVIAARIGRTAGAVQCQRQLRRIPPFRDKRRLVHPVE